MTQPTETDQVFLDVMWKRHFYQQGLRVWWFWEGKLSGSTYYKLKDVQRRRRGFPCKKMVFKLIQTKFVRVFYSLIF